jgi:hypothetical protein
MADTTTPTRVQRTRPRIKGQKGMPAGALYVGRPGKWGNPNRVVYRQDTGGWHVEHDNGGSVGSWPTPAGAAGFAVEAYRAHLADRPDLVEAARTELAGRDLACWCAPDMPCHADVLLELANAAAGPTS